MSRLSALPVSRHTYQPFPATQQCSRSTHTFSLKFPSCSLTGFRGPKTQNPIHQLILTRIDDEKNNSGEDQLDQDVGFSKVQVPRNKFIPVSKSHLLDAIVTTMFHSHEEQEQQKQVNLFLNLSKCLDSILHVEHKRILEEMRSDYYRTHPSEGNDECSGASKRNFGVINGKETDEEGYGEDDEQVELEKPMLFNYGLDLKTLLHTLDKSTKRVSDGASRVAVATRFQCSFMQLLSNAQFEELSARDLMLTSALNTDYLLTLPVYVDWKRAYQSNAIIFRRGYSTERQKGQLIVEKLDYLQSRLLRGIFFVISKPLGKLVNWINELYKSSRQTQAVQDWIQRLKLWLKELSVFQKSLYKEQTSDGELGIDQLSDKDLPIWLAAQRAVARYEGILSPVGPRGRLLRKLLSWVGLIPPTPQTPFELHSDRNNPEPHSRSISLSRISISDIWRPATRKYCGNDLWKMLETSVSILLSQSTLQEPAFQELILLYTEEVSERDAEDKAEVPSLQLKIYQKIPIPDLPVIFPHKKLSFRIIDTVRLDVATILGLLAYFINYKFEDVLSSPSAIFLDVVAISALIIYGSRVVLGYKQTWDRYQLLVNKTLYEKTLASGFGSVHFLLDASEQQQYKEAILAYAVLLKAEKGQATCRQCVGERCERFMHDMFQVKVEMPVDRALNTLLRLSLAREICVDGRFQLHAIPCSEAYNALKERWSSLLA